MKTTAQERLVELVRNNPGLNAIQLRKKAGRKKPLPLREAEQAGLIRFCLTNSGWYVTESDDEEEVFDEFDDDPIEETVPQLVRVGGYVSFDGRKKDASGWPIRETEEVYTDVDLKGHSADDCGEGTRIICDALTAKVAKRFKTDRNVECTECWRDR